MNLNFLSKLNLCDISKTYQYKSGGCSGLHIDEKFIFKGIDPSGKFLRVCLLPNNLHFNIRYCENTVFKII